MISVKLYIKGWRRGLAAVKNSSVPWKFGGGKRASWLLTYHSLGTKIYYLIMRRFLSDCQ